MPGKSDPMKDLYMETVDLRSCIKRLEEELEAVRKDNQSFAQGASTNAKINAALSRSFDEFKRLIDAFSPLIHCISENEMSNQQRAASAALSKAKDQLENTEKRLKEIDDMLAVQTQQSSAE